MNERTTRYQELLPIERLQHTPVTIIGTGAIGRQVALMLASMGVEHFTLFDPDVVSQENLGPQGFGPHWLGSLKVIAMSHDLLTLNPEIHHDESMVLGHCERYSAQIHGMQPVTFCCVDSIRDRKIIGRNILNNSFKFFVDGRMSAEYFEIYTPHSYQEYEQTLFPQEEAHQEGCTTKSTLYCASIAAGHMVAQYTKWLRGMDVRLSLSGNILAGLTVSKTSQEEVGV